MAYLELQIIHQANRVHSNVDSISRLRQRVPHQQGPTVDATLHISLDFNNDPLRDMYSELGEKFEEKLLNITSKYVNSNHDLPDYSHLALDGLELILPLKEKILFKITLLLTHILSL